MQQQNAVNNINVLNPLMTKPCACAKTTKREKNKKVHAHHNQHAPEQH